MDGIFGKGCIFIGKFSLMTITPDKKYNDRRDNSIRPSWTKNNGYVNKEHQEIFNETKDIPETAKYLLSKD